MVAPVVAGLVLAAGMKQLDIFMDYPYCSAYLSHCKGIMQLYCLLNKS